eukprot:CAMPEP_0198264264 /NCGR_PEP_ID=MMETSP1447-20131203/14985_1 /TAXON_ID=420782 /ORGANISM="Chaetoceros dichaeta, Strain CCMP1751" /LENGTH=335 /DNA_ID=CAMNT_0043953145 /DNA_START=17 /DNA_END=1024 /DNA_ORIENTATION=+
MIRLLIILLFVTASFTCGAEEECASSEAQKSNPTSTIEEKLEEKLGDELDDEPGEDVYDESDYEIDDGEEYYSDEKDYDEEYDSDEYDEVEDDYDNVQDVLARKLEDGDDWQDLTNLEFWYYLGCDEIFEQPLPIHNQSTWMLLRGVYHGIVGNENSSISPLSHEFGIRVPFEARRVTGKGRGVFATESVKKGDLVWNSRQTAVFTKAEDYREFLISISPGLACDVTQWAYIKDRNVGYDGILLDELLDEDNGKEDYVISVDLDEGILMNDGYYYNTTDHESEVQNVGCVPDAAEETPGGCIKNVFALRDISAGEELLLSYSDFSFSEAWKEFGL